MTTAQRQVIQEAGSNTLEERLRDELRDDMDALTGSVDTLSEKVEALTLSVKALGVDLRWVKWIGGAVALAVFGEMFASFFG